MTEPNLMRETKGPECCSVLGGRVLHYRELPSTNRTAFELAGDSASDGLIVVAQQQTEGRGRHGREWFSPEGKGLYFSILLKPRCPLEQLALLPVVAGTGVANGLEKLGVKDAGVKWPNDVLIAGRKVAGILVESRRIAGELVAVAGIGVNVATEEFPEELSGRATSILLASGRKYENEEVLGLLLGEIERYYSDMCLGRNEQLITELRRLDVLRGKQVTVSMGKKVTGTAEGIDANGGLILVTPDGQRHVVSSGEVELVRAANTGE